MNAARLAVALVVVVVLALAGAGDAARKWDSKMNKGLRMADGVVSDQYFNQTLDHFSDNNATFQQRYQVNDTYYNKTSTSPVFLLLGGEGPAGGTWLSIDTAIMVYAKKYNALVVQLEHRFYGKSQPFNDVSTAHLAYLTSEQALKDAATFQTFLTQNMSLPNNTKWVAFGGSYSGALAAWLRITNPKSFVGAVATSSPILAKINFFEYQEVVVDSLLTTAQNQQCINAIKKATGVVTALLQAPVGRTTLVSDFKVCDSALTDPYDVQNFWQNVANNFDEVVQYNKDNREFEGGPKPPTIDDLCAIMTNNTDSYQALVAVNNLILKASKEDCMQVSYVNYINAMSNVSLDGSGVALGRQWIYQTCNEFGYYQTSDTTALLFGQFNLDFFTKQCQDIFFISANEVVNNTIATNKFYGGKDITSKNATNIVFPNGSIDPWHILSLTETLAPSLPAIFIQGTAHCANMYPASADDLPALTDARAQIQDLIGTWIQ